MDAPATLHGAAAFLYLATIPKHTLVGLNNVQPATATIPPSYKMKDLITPTWQYCNLYLAASALLSIRWARLNGPSGMEEKAIIWLQALAGAVTGWQYFRNNMYPGLGVLWAAPSASLIAMIWQGA